MLKQYARLLLAAAPAIVDEGGGGEPAITSRPRSSWMKDLPPLETPDVPPKNEDANANPNDTGGRPAQPTPDQPALDAAAVAKAKEEEKAKAQAETERAAKPAADSKGAKKSDKPADADEIDQETMPRSTPDWEKYKAKYKGRTAELKTALATTEARVKEFEGKVAEYETKLNAAPVVDPAIQTENERLKAENAALNDKIVVLDVTQHPKFIAYFETKTKAAHEDAKAILGDEKGAEFVKLLGYPEGDWKNLQMEEFYAQLNDVQKSEIGTVRKELRAIDRERNDEIKNANDHKTKLVADQTEKSKAAAANGNKFMQQAFEQAVKVLQDPKEGSPIYQLKDGDEEWNTGVTKRIESVKTLLMGNTAKPEDIIRGAFQAAAYPDVLRAYRSEKAAWADEKTKLESQVKELTAALPGPGDAGGNGGGDAEEKLPADANPHDRGKAFAKRMVSAMTQGT